MINLLQDCSIDNFGLQTSIELGRDALGSFEESLKREWLVTNGIGGFAAGTVSLVNTRRYHGLLIAALRPPLDRVALVTKLDVTATYAGVHVPLATNEFADGTIAPYGFCHLESFRLEGLTPVWTWLISDARLEQRLWMQHGENATYVEFTRIGGSKPLHVSIDPLCTYRDYHSQSRGERAFGVSQTPGGFRIQAYDEARPYRILSTGGALVIQPQWYWNFKHREERARGLDDLEDLLRPASFDLDLKPGQTEALILTAEPHEPLPLSAARAAERTRQSEIVDRLRRSNRVVVSGIELAHIDRLALAADQFLVERHDSIACSLGTTVIAGYPWFGDWGRDTMIALPGLTLATGRSDIAARILRTFALYVSQGMVPNRFPDVGDAPEYNTADATLWFFVATHEYLRATDDRAFAAEIYPILKDILECHTRGTRFGIHMDRTDALLHAGEKGLQLTWMDAKVGDWVVTPRIGKPVEINALWFNAVSLVRDLARELDTPEVRDIYAALAKRIRASFEAGFWFEEGGYLYDVIDSPESHLGENGPYRDSSLRPNQIFALSLPYALLDGERAKQALDTCAANLWTPVGLRSLSPSDPRYVGRYGGDPVERDGAYHQGTVWTWLLGAFATAHYRVYADAAAALDFLRAIPAHLREGCIGQVSEIMDADPPFEPRGCFAQAWGVAEILRAWAEINDGENRRRMKAIRPEPTAAMGRRIIG